MLSVMNRKKNSPMKDFRAEYYWNLTRIAGAKYKEFHWPSTEFTLNLVHTYDVLSSHLMKLISPYGLSPSTFNILAILYYDKDTGYKQQDLSKFLLVSRANITGLIDSLVRKKLVKRIHNKNDRRICIAQITE